MTWDQWKEKDSAYKSWQKTVPSFAHLRYWQFLVNQILSELSSCNLLLDVGCGKGGLLNLAMESEKCVSAIGIDPIITNLKSIHRESIYRIRAVGENLPLKNCAVDVAIVKSTLDHVKNPQQVLVEMRRVTTNIGQLYVFQGIVKNSEPLSYTHLRNFTKAQLQHLLETAKLKIVKKKIFYSIRLRRIMILTPRICNFLGKFLGHESAVLIIATHKKT